MGKGLTCFIEPAGVLQSGGVIQMRPRAGWKIGHDHGDAIKFAPDRVRLPKPERSQWNDKNTNPFCAVQRPAWEKPFRRNIGCATADAERLPSRFLAHFPNESVVIKMEQRRSGHHTGEHVLDLLAANTRLE